MLIVGHAYQVLIKITYCFVFPDQQVATILQKTILDAFEAFAKETLSKFGLNPEQASLPVDVSSCLIYDVI